MSSWASAFAGRVRARVSGSEVGDQIEMHALNPKVVIMVGRNAEIDARAQFAPKYITPAAYICRNGQRMA